MYYTITLQHFEMKPSNSQLVSINLFKNPLYLVVTCIVNGYSDLSFTYSHSLWNFRIFGPQTVGLSKELLTVRLECFEIKTYL